MKWQSAYRENPYLRAEEEPQADFEELQRTGRIQIEADTDEDEIFRHMDTASASSAFEKRAANAEEALKILETYAPEKTGMLSALEGKKAISLKEYEKGVEIREQTLKDISALLAYRKNIGEARAAPCAGGIRAGKPVALDVSGYSHEQYRDAKTTQVFIGSLQGRWTEETLDACPGGSQAGSESVQPGDPGIGQRSDLYLRCDG